MAVANGLLAYLKAFRQRADYESMRNQILSKYDGSSIRAAKDILWRDCSTDLARLQLEKKVRRSSSTRSQELADLDDIIEAFDALDSDASLPEVVCSAEDLLQMPQLLPLCGTEQVAEDIRALRVDVCSRLEGIDKRLQLPFPAPSVSENGSNTNPRSNLPPRQAPDTYDRRSNVILFGIPEDKDLSVVSDVLQAVAGSHIAAKDTFRLGKQLKRPQQTGKQQSNKVSEKNRSAPSTHSSCTSEPPRPRPILIKLNCPWDRRLILAGKKRLSSINGMERYFLQPDLSIDERKKRRDAYLAWKTPASSPLSDSQ